MSEDKDLLSRISQLAGRINLHKEGRPLVPERTASPQQAPYPSDQRIWGASRRISSDRGRFRGARSARGFAHRHRSLVLNRKNEIPGSFNGSEVSVQSNSEQSHQVQDQDINNGVTHSSAWVSKRDRHMQLINSSIYDQKTSIRNRAIEQTRHQKKVRKEAREKQKINKHLQLNAGDPAIASVAHYLVLNGLRFQVCNGGSKLARDKSSDPSLPTPKTALIGGVKFFRSKNGNLYRSGLVKGRWVVDEKPLADIMMGFLTIYRMDRPGKKIDEPCKRFTTTGQCSSGPRCRYIHDPSRVAICREFLKSGKCPHGVLCDLSHDATYERVPACLHFLRGKCTKPDCRYPHVRVNPASQVCRAFSTLGYCSRGALCEDRHVLECPDYSSTGNCRDPSCRLPHVDRAGQLRLNAGALSGGSNSDALSEGSDISSEEENIPEMDSEDIDSDGLEEEMMLEPEEGYEHGLSQQDDFVPF